MGKLAVAACTAVIALGVASGPWGRGEDAGHGEGPRRLMAQESEKPAQLRLLLSEAEKPDVLYKLAYGDQKVLAKTIEDAITNVNPDRIKGALTALIRLGRTVELRHALAHVDHADESVATLAITALLGSGDLKQVKDMLKKWDELEAAKPERAKLVQDAVSGINTHPEALKELLVRAKQSKFPDQAQAALKAINQIIPDKNLEKLEDIEKAFKKPEFQKRLKGQATAQAATAGALQFAYPGISGDSVQRCGNNIWLGEGGTFSQRLSQIPRDEAKEGYEVRFKVYIHGKDDKVTIGAFEEVDGGGMSFHVTGTQLITDSSGSEIVKEFKAAGTWVDIRVWYLIATPDRGAMVAFRAGSLDVTTAKSSLFGPMKSVPKVTVTAAVGSTSVSNGEVLATTKGP